MYAHAGKQGVSEFGARRRTHLWEGLIRGQLWHLREERHGLTQCTPVVNGRPRARRSSQKQLTWVGVLVGELATLGRR